MLGDWVKQNDTTWRLLSCDPGYQLVNSLDGTSSGEYSHDSQHCAPCLLSEYIVDPNAHTCQRCPPGLVCRVRHALPYAHAAPCPGLTERNVLPQDGVVVGPKVEGSTWSVVDGVYYLETCPIGYRLYTEAPELQECR